jgi:hypothetical protein
LATWIVKTSHKYFDKEQIVRITGTDTDTVSQVWERDQQFALKQMQGIAKTKDEISKGMNIYKMERGISIQRQGANAYLSFTGSLLGDPTMFNVKAEGGVDTAHKKLDIANQTFALAKMGIQLDPKTVLDAMDYPLKEKALAAMPQWQAFLQFQAQQQQQQQMQDQVMQAEQKAKMKAQITQREAHSVVPQQGGFAGAGVNPGDNPNQQSLNI